MKCYLFFVFLLTTLSACKNEPEKGEEAVIKNALYTTGTDDIEMNITTKAANNSLYQFDSAFLSNKYDTSTFALKVRFPTSTGSEHIWATGIEIKNGNYYGVIDDIPELTTAVKQNERIFIKRETISDWMYADKGKLKGGFTIKLIRRKMSKAERKEFDESFPFKIEE